MGARHLRWRVFYSRTGERASQSHRSLGFSPVAFSVSSRRYCQSYIHTCARNFLVNEYFTHVKEFRPSLFCVAAPPVVCVLSL